MLSSILSNLYPYWRSLVAIGITVYLLKKYLKHGLYRFPGPVAAKFTDLWRFYDVWSRRPDTTHLRLHRKYGNIVRLGPNTLSFSSPTAVKTIYGLNKGFVKAVANGKRLPSLFSTTDEVYHARLRRCVNHAFTMTALKDYEPLVDETVAIFLEQTNSRYVQTGKTCDFAEWLQFFAFDVIGQITYSTRHGFVEREEDIGGMISFLGRLFSYVAPVGQIPVLDLLLMKNPIILWLDRLGFKPFAFPISTFAKTCMDERLNMTDTERSIKVARADLLGMFLRAQKDHPDFMSDERVLTMAVSMTFAGSETTAISLAAVFYHLLQDKAGPYQKLSDELDKAVRDGRIEDRATKQVSWSESQSLPYLDACIKEAFRMHPAVGLPLERVTPAEGITIDDAYIPGDTIVGVSAWVLHKDEMVFDPLDRYNVDEYHPERWLDEDLTHDQIKEMNSCMFQFGAGARTCIGKNISLLEIYKLVPSFLRRFDIEMADDGKGWTLHNAWFVKQLGFHVKFKER